jgi:hypothetical protein
MNKILIYSDNNNILIVANPIDVDLVCEYYSLIRDIPYPKKDFSYNVPNSEDCICAMTIQKNRYHFCKRYKRHYLARLQYKKLSTDNFTLALRAIDEIIKEQSIR